MKRGLLLAAVILMLLATAAFCQTTPEFRSLEATAWASGFENSSATTSFVNYARSCNMNAVIPELRLRCDAYYTSTLEPRGTGVTPAAGYDSLADLITKAHAVGMEVHPWVVAFRIWTTDAGPPHYSPIDHIWWTHGPGNTNPAQDWCMRSDTGAWSYGGISNLDPGHPAVEDYLISVFMEMVNNYDLDGLNLDYIRYPATSWGYNAVSVQRFNAEYGRSGNPNSGDATWQEWRRDQVTNLVKRLYLEIKTTKPWVKLSADVWNSWSTGNSSYFQDWNKWMQNHWIDFVHPMSYTSNNTTYHGWLDDYATRQYGRHVYPLGDVSIGVPDCVLPQIDLVRQHGFQGLGSYAYGTILNRTDLKNNLVAGPYSSFVSPPSMPWLDAPTTGYIKGFVKNQSSNAVYPATVSIVGTSATTKNTGTGFYGFVDVTPGASVTVRASAAGYNPVDTTVAVTAGQVTIANITLQAETIAPTITNVRSASVQATNAQILWDTDEASTSQVDYGLTTSYGTTTTEDILRTTAHTVQLVNLAPSTTYHYRVRSYDAVRNVRVSGDYTFTTTANDSPAPIIVDNTAVSPYFSLSGSWLTSTSAGDKYGTNYNYCSGATGGKVATWRPNVIVAGNYNVYAWWPAGGNRTGTAPYKVYWNGGNQTVTVSQKVNGGSWQLIKANAPFLIGTTGYITVSNSGVLPTENVMADAIKLEYADGTPPTQPTGLSASATAPGQISLSWTASTDNVGVTGYKVYRNGAQVTTAAGNSFTDSGLTYNTQYSYYVVATDAAGNLSSASSTVAKYSLSLAPGASSVTCDKPLETWQTTQTFTFTAVGGFGATKIQYYKYAWTQDPTYSWTGFESQWTSGNITPQSTSGGSWYLHVMGYNADNIANGEYHYGPYKYDGSAVEVANLEDGKYTSNTGQLHASWTGADPDSRVVEYQYAIGTSEGGTNIRGWTSTGATTSVTTTGLTLAANTKYYFSVKALNGAGAWSDPVNSDGVTAAVAVASILNAKDLDDGDAIMLTDRVISADLGAFCYACDNAADGRVSGIRVDGTGIEGDLADIAGILHSVNGEWVIQDPEISSQSGPGAPAALMMVGKSIGGGALNSTPGITDGVGTHNIGVLVTVIGRVENPGSGYFMLNDGSTPIKVSIARLTEIPGVGQFVKVTGIVSTELSGGVATPVIIPRANSDVPQPWH